MRIIRKTRTPFKKREGELFACGSATWDPVRWAFPSDASVMSLNPEGDCFPSAIYLREKAYAKYGSGLDELRSEVVGVFWGDVGRIDSSAVLQLAGEGEYVESAKRNRERLASDRKASARIIGYEREDLIERYRRVILAALFNNPDLDIDKWLQAKARTLAVLHG